MIELRRVETEADADVFLALRGEIDPAHMASRAAYLEDLRSPRRLDLLGLLDGAPVGTGFVEPHGDDLAGDGPEGWISVRVLQRHLVAASAPNCSGLYRLALVPTVEARSRCR